MAGHTCGDILGLVSSYALVCAEPTEYPALIAASLKVICPSLLTSSFTNSSCFRVSGLCISAGLLPRVSYCIPDLVGLRLAMC